MYCADSLSLAGLQSNSILQIDSASLCVNFLIVFMSPALCKVIYRNIFALYLSGCNTFLIVTLYR